MRVKAYANPERVATGLGIEIPLGNPLVLREGASAPSSLDTWLPLKVSMESSKVLKVCPYVELRL